MLPKKPLPALPMQQLVRVRPEPPGQFTAQLVGVPEIQATAETRGEAVALLGGLLAQWLESGELALIEVPRHDLAKQWSEWAQADPEYNLFVDEVRRFREEQDERGRNEQVDPSCLPSSSTPAT